MAVVVIERKWNAEKGEKSRGTKVRPRFGPLPSYDGVFKVNGLEWWRRPIHRSAWTLIQSQDDFFPYLGLSVVLEPFNDIHF